MVLKFYITTDNSQLTHGHSFSGKICVELDRKLAIEGVHFKLLGKTEFKYVENGTDTESTNSRNGANHETLCFKTGIECFESDEFLIGKKGGKIILPAGLPEFPFKFKLPNELPSTAICGTHGRVIFLIISKIKEIKPFFEFTKANNHIVQFTFIINGVLDLNNELFVDIPIKIHVKIKLCYEFIGQLGLMHLKLTIPRKGFALGESIEFSVEINNPSQFIVTCMEMSLIQKVTRFTEPSGMSKVCDGVYLGTNASTLLSTNKKVVCSSNNVILKQIGPGVAKGNSGSWFPRNSFKIPSILPHTASFEMVDVQYILSLEVKFEKEISANIKLIQYPIIIGTIPLMSPSSMIQELMSQPRTNETVYLQMPELPNYSDLDPPSYSNAMDLEKISDLTDGNNESTAAGDELSQN